MDTRYPMSARVALQLGDPSQALQHSIRRGPSDATRNMHLSDMRSNVGDAPIYARCPTHTHAPDEVLSTCPRPARASRAVYFDHVVVDPTFTFIQNRVFVAADAEHNAARVALQGLAKTEDWVFAATPVVMTLGILLLLAVWRVLRQYQRRADEAISRDARREAEIAEATAEAERAALRRSEEHLRALVQYSSDIIAVINADGTISYLNAAVESVLDLPRQALLGSNVYDVVHGDDVVRLRQVHADLLDTAGARSTSEARLHHRDGSWRYVEIIATNMTDVPSVGGVVVNVRDVTERKAFEDQLQHQAFHDSLTGLPNRALFFDHVERALARARRHRSSVAVLFLDLDRFKVVNDSLGHAAGDHLLVMLAARLHACVRAEDTVARFGGDEFAILLGELAASEDVLRVVERINQELDTTFHLDGHDVVTKTSIGIATSAVPTVTAAELLRDADVALYRAKGAGRGRYVVFDATMQVRALERLELEADLRLALERDEFRVYYQPKIALGTGQLAGMEALVRWQSPTRGLVAPAAFIPVAEETGLIRPLGQWVLEEACRQTARWNADLAKESPIVVSVNLSARQFAQPTLVAEVARALRESGMTPCHLQLEITETVAMGDAEATIETLRCLKGLGVQLAIDDFGTGYSSLAYLKRFPVDTLKIDRSFVSGLERESEGASIINAVVSLSHALKLSVVAEGIETAGELAQVRDMGCEQGQGYYWAKPLPLEQAETFLRGLRPVPVHG